MQLKADNEIKIDELVCSSESDRLRSEANLFFSANNYEKAIELYSSAISIDSQNELLYSNRSLCYLQLKNFESAILDAERSILCNSAYEKGHYRLISALFCQKSYNNLIRANLALTAARQQFPTSNAFNVLEKQITHEIESRRLSVFSRPNSQFAPSEWTSQESTAWRILIESVEKEVNDGRGASGHNLPSSTFSRLTDRDCFHDIIFPGLDTTSTTYIKELYPKTLFELMQNSIYSPVIRKHLPSVISKAKGVLNNVKSKAIQENSSNTMDPILEANVIWPQILQESFAREVIKIVQNCNRRLRLYSTMSSELIEDCSNCDNIDYIGIDSSFFNDIGDHDVGFNVQQRFLGNDWFDVLLTDIHRFVIDFRLRETHGQFLWLDDTEERVKLIEESYPALYEVMVGYLFKLHLLANQHMDGHMKLLKPGKGSCGIVLYSYGDDQACRYDACCDLEEDSGYRLTVNYHIPLTSSKIEGGDLLLLNSRQGSLQVEIAPLADSLVMFRSMRVSSSRRPVQSQSEELVCITMWISGKTLESDWVK